jgi:hypothetical protein
MISDFILPFLNDALKFGEFDLLQAFAHRELHARFEPELSLTVRRKHVNMQTGFFAGEKKNR